MGLTNRKEEQLKSMPIVESRVQRSKDGKFIVHKTIFTHIKPVEYYNAVISSPTEEQVVEA